MQDELSNDSEEESKNTTQKEKRPFGKNIETREYYTIISLTGLIEPNNRKGGGDEEFLKSINECHQERQRLSFLEVTRQASYV
jgi:hypothetical protein